MRWTVLLLCLGLSGCALLPAAGPDDVAVQTQDVPPMTQQATVVHVIDGDTVVLRGIGSGPLRPGRDTKVRILEIDTPEVRDLPECFGDEASRYAARMLPVDSTVRVLADRDLEDRYGRTLLYVWTADGVFYDEAAVRNGYARAVVYPPNDRYIDRLRAAERAARTERRGMWGAC